MAMVGDIGVGLRYPARAKASTGEAMSLAQGMLIEDYST